MVTKWRGFLGALRCGGHWPISSPEECPAGVRVNGRQEFLCRITKKEQVCVCVCVLAKSVVWLDVWNHVFPCTQHREMEGVHVCMCMKDWWQYTSFSISYCSPHPGSLDWHVILFPPGEPTNNSLLLYVTLMLTVKQQTKVPSLHTNLELITNSSLSSLFNTVFECQAGHNHKTKRVKYFSVPGGQAEGSWKHLADLLHISLKVIYIYNNKVFFG